MKPAVPPPLAAWSPLVMGIPVLIPARLAVGIAFCLNLWPSLQFWKTDRQIRNSTRSKAMADSEKYGWPAPWKCSSSLDRIGILRWFVWKMSEVFTPPWICCESTVRLSTSLFRGCEGQCPGRWPVFWVKLARVHLSLSNSNKAETVQAWDGV